MYSTSLFTVAAVVPSSLAMRELAHPWSASSRTLRRRSSRAFCAEPVDVAADLDFAFVADLRPRRLVGPAARFSASRRNASSAEIVLGSYCLGSDRFVSPSVMYAP